MTSPYTPRQGQFLAFIHQYISLHGRAPSEADMVRFFQIAPPSVHQMILTLERRGLIRRTPGEARSISLVLPPESLPGVRRQAPETVSRPDAVEATMLKLGEIQLEEIFRHLEQNPIGTKNFVPLLDALIGTFARFGASKATERTLRRRALEIYHEGCVKDRPKWTLEQSRALLTSFLPPARRSAW